MIQLRILSGKMAGETQIVRHFPFSIGRAETNDLRLDEAGVWENHLTLAFQKNEGFTFKTFAGALVAVNHQPLESARLRNGDIFSFGSAQIQFWLAPARLRNLRPREILFWMLLILVTLGQFVLIYALLK
jgi:pSer/pThr/pTyr-binding forkhead associated (FHA) protein